MTPDTPPGLLRRAARKALAAARPAPSASSTTGLAARLGPAARPDPDAAPRPFYVGWTRYSAFLQDTGGLDLATKDRFPDADAYRAHLWAKDRMAARSHMFLTLSVPLLQAMRERHDYRHVVTYSPEMPEPWLSQLLEAAERYDVLVLRPVAAGAPVAALRDLLVADGRPSGPAVWFRIDDDDLLPTDYLDLIDAHVAHVGPGWAVCLGMGYDALWHEGEIHHIRRKHRPTGSHGQAFSGWWDADAQALSVPEPGNHRMVDRRSPTVVDSRPLAWIRLSHAWQDSGTKGRPTREELAAPLLRNPSRVQDETDLMARWPTLEGVHHPDPR